jgi:hypothetical protein
MRPWPTLFVAIVGCSGESPTPPVATPVEDSGTATAGDAATARDAAREVATADTATACPNNVGDILCDLPLEGYVRDGVAEGLATDQPYTATTLYAVLARGTQKYALIWTSGYW